MEKKILESNEDLVRDLMRFSKHGPLSEVFIITAIQSYATWCVASQARDRSENDMVDPRLWRLIAEDVKARCDAFYGRNAPALVEEPPSRPLRLVASNGGAA